MTIDTRRTNHQNASRARAAEGKPRGEIGKIDFVLGIRSIWN